MIRVRIAPSPTGSMHVGTARTALFNWLFAKKNNGVFMLRIEDTDKERSKKEYERSILSGLKWLGLDYEEGPVRQSERGEIYFKYIRKLLESGRAFYCDHSKEELEKEKEEQMAKREAPRHNCNFQFSIFNFQTTPKPRGIIRFRNPGGKIKFNDLVRGKIEFDAELLGDFAIAKDENTPLYNFAAVVDDCEMQISHVIRGEDHISNTPKQILLQNALSLSQPKYAHLPMILGPDKSKLSKRHGATSLLEYKELGYLPDAMFNFLALLGWSPGDDKEILSRDEIIKKFSLSGVQKSGAVFNIEKLDWMNGEYIRQTPIDMLTTISMPYLEKAYNIQHTIYDIQKIIALEQPRLKKLSEIGERTEFFFKDKLDYSPKLLKWKDMGNNEIKEILGKLEKLLDEIPGKNYTKKKLEEILMPKAEEWGRVDGKIDRGRVLWPLRVALTGRKASPGPFEVAEILGKKKCLARVREAQSFINRALLTEQL